MSWVTSVLKYSKASKHCYQNCLNFFFPFCTSNDDSNFSKKYLFLGKNLTYIKKLPISKVKNFLMKNFWRNSNMENSAYTKTSNFEIQFIFLLKFIQILWCYKKYKKIGVWRVLGQVIIKNFLEHTILDKIYVTKWSNPVKLDMQRKVLVSILACSVTFIWKV